MIVSGLKQIYKNIFFGLMNGKEVLWSLRAAESPWTVLGCWDMEGCLFEGFCHWGLENLWLFLGTKRPLPPGICCPTILLVGCLSRLSVPRRLWLSLWLGFVHSFVPALQSALRLVLYLSMFVLFLSLELGSCWVWIWIKGINVGKFYLCSSNKFK